MEMGQGTRKKTKRRKTSNFPTPKHREVMYQLFHWTIQTCQSRAGNFLRRKCQTESKFVYLGRRAILANSFQLYPERRENVLLCSVFLGKSTQITCHMDQSLLLQAKEVMVFPGGSVVKNPPANAGDARENVGLIPESGRSPGGGNGDPLQYSCLENCMDRGAWQYTVCGVEELDMTERTHSHKLSHFPMFWLATHSLVLKGLLKLIQGRYSQKLS